MIVGRLARAVLDLPPRRTATTSETTWVAMPDGVRLATHVVRPAHGGRAPVVVMRTPYGARSWRTPLFLLAGMLAEWGYAVVLQDVRGRYASEGRFEPFVSEGEDGGHTLDWVRDQPWAGARIGLVGFSYLAFAAWAAQARRPEAVQAVVAGIGAADVHAAFYPGGAFSLETALRWATHLGEHEGLLERQVDLVRGLAHRPVREADRVAVRERSYYRDWLDHPRRDAWWERFLPDPSGAPATLMLAGWYDFFLNVQLREHAVLAARHGEQPLRLVVGPWSHGRYVQRERSPRERWFARTAVLEILRFLDRTLRDGDDPGLGPARAFPLGGAGWRDLDAWPPPGTQALRLHLRSDGGANTRGGSGRLDPESAADGEAPDRFTYDPDLPVPSAGGALLGPGGAVDQRPVEARDDVLCYTSAPFERGLELAGPVRCVLFAASSAPDTDFVARLVDVAPDGRAVNLCEGVVRCRWRDGGAEPTWLEPGEPVRLEIDMAATCARLAPGHRLRLDVTSSSLPRYDRHPNTRDDPARAEKGVPARQTVLHDPQHPSHLELRVLGG